MSEIKEPLLAFSEYPGPILLLSGPGTGKTYQLAMRVKFLLEELKAEPSEISVITFTVEAARNMRERLCQEDINIPLERHPEVISTMHSLGNTIIRSNPERFGFSGNPEVLHESNPRKILLKDAAYIVGYEKKEWELVDDCRRKGDCQEDENEVKCTICKEYKSILRKCLLLDYDDQIMLACNVLRDDKELLEECKKTTKFLLVDEYQDINQAQCELIQLLTENQREGLFAVGDDDLSIYSFRGGNPKYIREFNKYFGDDYKLGRLSMSWRCPEHILLGAHNIIRNFYKDSVPKPNPTFSEGIKSNNKIVFYDLPSENVEARIIAYLAKERVKTNKVIIIIPNSNYLPPIKNALTYAELDYKYRVSLKEDGLKKFTILADWVNNPNNNLRARYLIDSIVNNYDDLTKKFETENNGLTTKRLRASKFLAEFWREVGCNNSYLACVSSKDLDNCNRLAKLQFCISS